MLDDIPLNWRDFFSGKTNEVLWRGPLGPRIEPCKRCGYAPFAAFAAFHEATCNVEPLNELAVLLEAEFILMEHWEERHGCGCPRHRAWRVE